MAGYRVNFNFYHNYIYVCVCVYNYIIFTRELKCHVILLDTVSPDC